jgi:hypothetical protein
VDCFSFFFAASSLRQIFGGSASIIGGESECIVDARFIGKELAMIRMMV